jgi:PAS domain-containing protein
VQISYTAVSLSDPEAIRFRYKLQETDKDWHEAAAATPITYRNLPPGSYHFSVEASDTNGVWSGAPANMAFTILPAFYQTIWFRGLYVLVFFTLLWAGFQMRVHQLKEKEKIFREAVETMPALAFVTDAKGNRTFMNKGWLEYTGLTPEQPLVQEGRRRFTLMISTASPNDGANRRLLANRWIVKCGSGAHRTESIAGSRRAPGLCAIAEARL